MGSHPIQEAVEIFLAVSCYRNQDKPRPDGLLGSCADLTYFPLRLAGKVRYSRSTMIKLKEVEMLANFLQFLDTFQCIEHFCIFLPQENARERSTGNPEIQVSSA